MVRAEGVYYPCDMIILDIIMQIIIFFKKILLYIVRTIVIFISRLLPLQNKVILDNFRGDGFGDDPKYIAQELSKEKGLKIIWCYMNKVNNYPSYITPVKTFSIKFFYHLCTSKVWVDNVRGTFWVKKRDKQFYIQTWHGTLSLKKVEKEAPTIPESWKTTSMRDGTLTDLMYTNNDFQKWKYENSFWYNGPVIKCDVPRVGILLNPPQKLKIEILNFFAINDDSKIILYAPTFRQDHNMDAYMWNYERILNELETKFGGHYVMLLRLHPRIAAKCSDIKYNSRIINATNYPDMQELLAISDIEINDYSSSMFDFGVLKRPVFLFCKDLETYKNSDRGLEFDFEQLPFPVVQTEDAFVDAIRNFDISNYKEKVTSFYDSIGYKDTGKGADYLARIIIKHIK